MNINVYIIKRKKINVLNKLLNFIEKYSKNKANSRRFLGKIYNIFIISKTSLANK